MTMSGKQETSEAWDRFQDDMKSLAGDLRRHYRDADDEKRSAEINQSLRQLGDAAEKFFNSLDVASRDPEVRASTKRAARSFGTALRETFRDVSSEVEKAFREPAGPGAK
jgi:hypothetical protein